MGRLWVVALLYLGITAVMTWPIAARLDRDVPSDLGDPAFVAGIMAWGGEHWLDLFSGDLTALGRFWNAPIFFPERSTIAYSEHFAVQSLLTLPAYAITRNPVLIYNLAYLSTFVIGAFGMYLLVRELSGSREGFCGAAFVAGLAYVFTPYRVATLPHLQVLSSQWMPFVLLGIHRYLRQPDSNGLLIAGAALWAQNLSSGYYMLMFAPFVALFTGVALWTHRLWDRTAVWRDLFVTFAVTCIATLPFALPYLTRTEGTTRALAEVIGFSADVNSWITASPLLHVWGDLRTLDKGEGYLFPGVTVVVLALAGIWVSRHRYRLVAVFGGLALVLSVWLAFGPQVQLDTQPTGIPALYRLLWEYVPGFNAARVPSRFVTITVLALSLLSGFALLRAARPYRTWVIAVSAAVILAEGAAFPLPTNGVWSSAPATVWPPEARLYRLADGPPVYRYLARLEQGSVAAHFPFGLPEREIQYGYYAMLHGTPIINGYSGAFPPTYGVRGEFLSSPATDPQGVQMILDVDRVTHVVVHRGAYLGDGGNRVLDVLQQLGWRVTAAFADDLVLTRATPGA